MTKMTKKERFKKFTKDNADLIAAAAYFTAAAGLVVVTVRGFKQLNAEIQGNVDCHENWVANENSWLDEQESSGKKVALLSDMTYLLIPADTEVEWIKDRPKHP